MVISGRVPEYILEKRRRLNEACNQTIRRGSAPGTRQNHLTQQKSYYRFCEEYFYEPFPATDWRYIQYGQYLAWQDKVPDTIDNYVGTVRVMHKLADLPVPPPKQIHFKWFSEGLRKLNTKPVRQAGAMTHNILRNIHGIVDFTKELHVVTFIALLVAFTMVLRVSNIGPISRKAFDAISHLTRADFQIIDGHPSLGLRWSKTVQHRNRTKWTPILPFKSADICPVKWLMKMLRIIPALPHEPLFLVREKHHRYPLTSTQVRRLLAMWCKQLGLDHKIYTPHSLRTGGLNWAHKAHITGESLQMMGGWRSAVYLTYVRSEFEDRLEAGKKMTEIEI